MFKKNNFCFFCKETLQLYPVNLFMDFFCRSTQTSMAQALKTDENKTINYLISKVADIDSIT